MDAHDRAGRDLHGGDGLAAGTLARRHALVGAVAGVAPVDVAALSLHGAATMAASAAVRLRGLDPVAAQVVVVDLHPLMSALADQAAAVPDPTALPSGGSVVVDLLAEVHRHEESRLFAS